jgi:hypothetical protein
VNGSDDIRVPTLSLEVSIALTDGRREEVTIFLSSASSFHDGPETLDEFLEEGRRFIAVRPREGKSYLLGIEGILYVSAPSSAPILSRLPGRVSSSINFVRVKMEGGEEIEGTLLANLPAEASRVSDAFNQPESFIPVESGECVVYVRKSRVTRVDF